MPKLCPAPRIAQNKSGLLSSDTVIAAPFASTMRAEINWSDARPYLPCSQPCPPPRIGARYPTQSQPVVTVCLPFDQRYGIKSPLETPPWMRAAEPLSTMVILSRAPRCMPIPFLTLLISDVVPWPPEMARNGFLCSFAYMIYFVCLALSGCWNYLKSVPFSGHHSPM